MDVPGFVVAQFSALFRPCLQHGSPANASMALFNNASRIRRRLAPIAVGTNPRLHASRGRPLCVLSNDLADASTT